jgi:hypothetical protein
MSYVNLRQLYEKTRQRRPSIVEIDEVLIDALQKESEKSPSPEATVAYIIITVSAIFFFATYPTLVVKSYKLVQALQTQLALSLSQREFLNNHLEVTVSCGFVFVTIIGYVLVIPPSFLNRLSGGANVIFASVKRMSFLYLAYASIAVYVSVFFPLLFLYSYEPIPQSVTKWLTLVWLLVPMLLLSAIPTLILLFILVIIVINRHGVSTKSTPAHIIYRLLKLLDKTDQIKEASAVTLDQKRDLVDSVSEIAGLISSLYQNVKLSDGATIWSIKQMQQAGQNFLLLSSWIYFPQTNTFDRLSDRLCFYLNVFLTGRYHDLPRESVAGQPGLAFLQRRTSAIRKLIELLMFALYLGVPIAIFAGTISFFHVNVAPLIQSSLGLLYIIWAVLGFFSFSEKFAPDARSFLMDVFKSYVERK